MPWTVSFAAAKPRDHACKRFDEIFPDMNTYFSFLRGINMAGHKIIKMEDLRKCFESMRFKNVRTYIQSGNVMFESTETNTRKLGITIEKGLIKSFGFEISVFLRTLEEMQSIAQLNPFKNITTHANSKMFVTFVSEEIRPRPKAPLWTSRKDVEVIAVRGHDLFSLSHEVNGRFGFPNPFIEKEFGVAATTRNWNTLRKLAAH